MKIETVLEMFKFLGTIKLNKFPKELRTPILLNHTALNNKENFMSENGGNGPLQYPRR